MPDSNILLYITAELAVLLLLLCAFLLMHVGKLKKLIRKLEDKIVSLRKSVGKAKKETKNALNKLAEKENAPAPKAYIDYLDSEIDLTKDHHQSLNPDRDIVLDIAPDTPLERQATSLRHAFLIAEKEARYAGDEEESSWDVLQAKFQQIIQFYASSQPAPEEVLPDETIELEAGDDHAEEIESYKKRIENLERFKKLFFDMEGKWTQAKKEAEDYHQQLLAMGKDLGAGDDFEEMMDRYAKSFDDVGNLIIEAGGGDASDSRMASSSEDDIDERERPSVGKTVIANQEEMQRLRNMAVDQHKVITELKKKLYEADSIEEKQEVIDGLTKQLEQQERFIKEAETCTQLIEDELSRTMKENDELREQIENSGGADASDEELKHIESVVNELTNESKEMLSTIASLEAENQSLKEMLEASGDEPGAGANDENTEALKGKLAEMQQELLNLQTQHIELEERYLELKMQ